MTEWIADLAHALYNLLLGMGVRQKDQDISASVSVGLGSGYSREAEEDVVRSRIVERARGLIGTRYKLGAEVEPDDDTHPDFLDCSELVELVYAQESYFHTPMLDGARYQYEFCKKVDEPKAGDLGFLRYISHKSNQPVWHVGIFSGQDTMIHASASRGEVVEDPAIVFTHHEGWKGWGRHRGLL